jgi:chromosome segregation ATPase
MTKWSIPEGRKPLTDADMADLTRRLADTAIEQSELYQDAKRDAEEAEAYAAELEAKLQDMALDCLAAQGQAEEAYQAQLVAEARIEELEVELKTLRTEKHADAEAIGSLRDKLAEIEKVRGAALI